MSKNYNKPSFKKLLEKLQEDSWQLELLISGFAIFGLFYAIDPVRATLLEALRGGETIFANLISMILMFLYIMIFNLILHIILRGLWIGALGLRYVSGEIDYEALNYSEKFTTYLKKKVGSFDNYIGKLENYCSVIFAISFLLIFYIIAIAVVIVVINLIGNNVLENDNIPKWIIYGIGWPLMIFVFIGAFLTFLDLLTAGFLKKKQWFSKLYFPFYRAFSMITLSFLYRPLVYNFLDNKFGKRVSLSLVPFYFLVLLTTTFYYQKSNFFTGKNVSSEIIANHNNYDDLRKEGFRRNISFTIPSKVINESYIKIYVPFHKSIENFIYKFNSNLEPKIDERGLQSDINIGTKLISKEKKIKNDSLRVAYVKTFNDIYTVKIDSTTYKTDFIIDKIKREKFGFEMYLGIKHLSEGKHMLIISKQIKKDSIGTKVVSRIPFWYYKSN
ncbi:MAG: hypothetical protein V3U80_11155 [Flavobacteriaceae bacterium]